MENASFIGILRIMFYFFAIYYIFKFLARIFFPIIAKKMFEKAAENIKKQQEHYNRKNTNQSVNNKEMPNGKKIVGDYIDYEEVE